MEIGWQEIVVLALVVLAAGLLARRALHKHSQARGCCGGACHPVSDQASRDGLRVTPLHTVQVERRAKE